MSCCNNQKHHQKKQREKLLEHTKKRMGSVFTSNQILGRIHTIGCVAVEITQKCNLDCTLCYLSEHSQSVKDIPIEEVYRRLERVVFHYGEGTHVQITGGDPTLRKHTELVEIVRYARQIGLYPALFTNGIAATRPLLEKLSEAGLADIAFHVDTTQRRKEGETESELNDIRLEYMKRTEGLGLQVMFNTTIHRENFEQLPELIEFFKKHAGFVNLVSFQLQAETGRGEWGSRDVIINQETVRNQIESGAGCALPWDAIQVGHTDCHSYLPTLVSNNKVFPLVPSKEFFSDFVKDFSDVQWDRVEQSKTVVLGFLKTLLRRPKWWFKGFSYLIWQLKNMFMSLVKSKAKVNRLTFFVQNFMDANHLDQERVGACSFMVMTANGPVSMCEHNAYRDDYILQPLEFKKMDGTVDTYQPLKNQEKIRNSTLKNTPENTNIEEEIC